MRSFIATIGPHKRLVAATGFITLDLVITNNDEQSLRTWAGGTCGNILTILSYLGWHAYPIARLHRDAAFARIEHDLTRWGVQLDYINMQPDTPTPMLVHNIRHHVSGVFSHSYSHKCPGCSRRLPDYRPLPIAIAERVALKLDQPAVFFMDRVSPGALFLADACRREGAIVVFEPNGVGDPRLFREALSLAHVVKYAHARLCALDFPQMQSGPLLTIETLGLQGLRYHSSLPTCPTDGWEYVQSYKASSVRDTAGAGDWCTAGIINAIGGEGIKGLLQATHLQLSKAFRMGQAMASWNCRFEGARGGMYVVDSDTFRAEVRRIVDGADTPVSAEAAANTGYGLALADLCSACAS